MSIQTLDVPKEVVLPVNAELSIPVGTKMDITNESILYNVFLQESETQPPADTEDKASHISMPANGEYEILSGSSTYSISGDLTVRGTANDVLDIRITKSTDGGATYPLVINHVRRVVNNTVGPRDVAFFPISFVEDLDKGDRIRLEIENVLNTNDATMELDSFISIKED